MELVEVEEVAVLQVVQVTTGENHNLSTFSLKQTKHYAFISKTRDNNNTHLHVTPESGSTQHDIDSENFTLTSG